MQTHKLGTSGQARLALSPSLFHIWGFFFTNQPYLLIARKPSPVHPGLLLLVRPSIDSCRCSARAILYHGLICSLLGSAQALLFRGLKFSFPLFMVEMTFC